MKENVYDKLEKVMEKYFSKRTNPTETVCSADNRMVLVLKSNNPEIVGVMNTFELSEKPPIEQLEWTERVIIPMDYLMDILDTMRKEDKVIIYAKKDYPIKLEFNHKNGTKTEAIIAPIIDNE